MGGASDRERWSQDGTYEWHDAENKIIDGALQIIASRIAGQLTHETKGEPSCTRGGGGWRRSETGKDGQIDAPHSGLRVFHLACNALIFHSDELASFPGKPLLSNKKS